MSELIDLWRAIELLSDKRCDCNFFVDGQTAYEALSDMIKAVKELPRIDIVMCGECIHKIQALSTEKGATGCEIISGVFYEDFFCKCGERRADDKTEESRP